MWMCSRAETEPSPPIWALVPLASPCCDRRRSASSTAPPSSLSAHASRRAPSLPRYPSTRLACPARPRSNSLHERRQSRGGTRVPRASCGALPSPLAPARLYAADLRPVVHLPSGGPMGSAPVGRWPNQRGGHRHPAPSSYSIPRGGRPRSLQAHSVPRPAPRSSSLATRHAPRATRHTTHHMPRATCAQVCRLDQHLRSRPIERLGAS